MSPVSNRASVQPHEAGFALVIVLWVLAGLTVIAVVVASSARVSSENTKLLRDRVHAEAAFVSTSARVKVIAAAGVPLRMSVDGPKGRLLLDGRPASTAEAGEQVAAQDARGLVDLNRVAPDRLRGLLIRCGAGDSQATELVDTLGDYIDVDKDKRLNGAEAFEYRAVSMPEPRNAKLLSREEIWRVKGWAELRSDWVDRGCNELVTVYGDGRFNMNTAPAALLEVAGLTSEAASATLDARRDGFEVQATPATTGGGDFMAALGGGYAGSTMRVTHRLESAPWILVYDLELTPSRNGGPWRVHEIRYRPRRNDAMQPSYALPAPEQEPAGDQRQAPNALSNSLFAN